MRQVNARRLVAVLVVLAALHAVAPANTVYKSSAVASYYADKFHGRKTSNGETFNMWAMTAAHKTLPFNTLVKVTNLSNGKSVVVRINDRGPFVAGREIDLSKGAAAKLDMIKSGTARVSLTIVTQDGSTWTPPAASSGQYWDIQLGAFSQKENAGALVRRLQDAGFSDLAYQSVGNLTRVIIRNVPTVGVQARLKRLEEKGFRDWLVRERPKDVIIR